MATRFNGIIWSAVAEDRALRIIFGDEREEVRLHCAVAANMLR
jgi:hypothetical protein